MSQLFRKEAMGRRSRALFGEVILARPLPVLITLGLILSALALMAYILFGIDVEGGSVIDWLRARGA